MLLIHIFHITQQVICSFSVTRLYCNLKSTGNTLLCYTCNFKLPLTWKTVELPNQTATNWIFGFECLDKCCFACVYDICIYLPLKETLWLTTMGKSSPRLTRTKTTILEIVPTIFSGASGMTNAMFPIPMAFTCGALQATLLLVWIGVTSKDTIIHWDPSLWRLDLWLRQLLKSLCVRRDAFWRSAHIINSLSLFHLSGVYEAWSGSYQFHCPHKLTGT